MTDHIEAGDYHVDANGCPADRVVTGGQPVIVHYDDIPESDITSVNGIPCTTPLRTVIDLAPQLGRDDLALMVRHCLDRGLFTAEDVLARVVEPDMQARRGATLLRQALSDPSMGS